MLGFLKKFNIVFRFCSSLLALYVMNAVFLDQPNFGELVAVAYVPMFFAFILAVISVYTLRNYKRKSTKIHLYQITKAVIMVSAFLGIIIYMFNSAVVATLLVGSSFSSILSYFRVYYDISEKVSEKIFIENMPSLIKILAAVSYYLFGRIEAYVISLLLFAIIGLIICVWRSRKLRVSYKDLRLEDADYEELGLIAMGGLPALLSGPILIGVYGYLHPGSEGQIILISIQLSLFISSIVNASISLVQVDLWKREISKRDLSVYTLVAVTLSALSALLAKNFISSLPFQLEYFIIVLALVRFSVFWYYSNLTLFNPAKLILKPVLIYLSLLIIGVNISIEVLIIFLYSFEIIYIATLSSYKSIIYYSVLYFLLIYFPWIIFVVISVLIMIRKSLLNELLEKVKIWGQLS